MNPEDLYRALIDAIPPEIRVVEALAGPAHSMVMTEEGVGVVMALEPTGRKSILPAELTGLPLRDLASMVLSWNATDSTLGGAALNAYYNSPPMLRKNFGYDPQRTVSPEGSKSDPFARYTELARGKHVASVGHFPSVEQYLAPVAASLSILDTHPWDNDYPPAAAEFILPQMDMVFISGSTLTNKTLPRLLELSRQAFVVLVGPSTCMAPVLFSYGVAVLSGTLYTDREGCLSLVQQGEHKKLVQHGQKVSFERSEYKLWTP